MEKIKIHWATKEHNIPGNALGYNQHNSAMRKFSEPYLEFDDSADIALTICPADLFVPVAGKFNVLFTMWESLDLPNNYLQRIVRADVLIVPCTFCRDLLRPHFEGPIYVCREGIDPSKFQYHERHLLWPGEKFRFLWIGASNPRKGYPIIVEIADKIVQRYKNIEIYLKTTTQKMDRKTYVTKLWKQRNAIRSENPSTFKEMLSRAKNPDVSDKVIKTGQHENVIWDSRILPFNELVELYNSAHCFLFPTFGEGWGLTLCEAMATGLPAIATPITGCADYFDDEVGYTIKHDIKYSEFTNYNIISRVFCPDTNHVVKRMFEVMQNYPEALRRGRRGSDRIRNKFTWGHSAQRLKDIIHDIWQRMNERRTHNTDPARNC